jgi:hypothetical protein
MKDLVLHYMWNTKQWLNDLRDPLLQQTLKTTFMWWELHLPADSEGPADNEIK